MHIDEMSFIIQNTIKADIPTEIKIKNLNFLRFMGSTMPKEVEKVFQHLISHAIEKLL